MEIVEHAPKLGVALVHTMVWRWCSDNFVPMLRRVLTILVLSIFLLYSQSLLVMWSLYFLERHDIVLYFYPEELGSLNPFAGARYVHELIDAQKGKGEGALVLLHIVDRAVYYLPTVIHSELVRSAPSLAAVIDRSRHPSDGFPTIPFVPPRCAAVRCCV